MRKLAICCFSSFSLKRDIWSSCVRIHVYTRCKIVSSNRAPALKSGAEALAFRDTVKPVLLLPRLCSELCSSCARAHAFCGDQCSGPCKKKAVQRTVFAQCFLRLAHCAEKCSASRARATSHSSRISPTFPRMTCTSFFSFLILRRSY
jgi:hypothetical protein